MAKNRHFLMLDEIFEQPSMLNRILSAHIEKKSGKIIFPELNQFRPSIKRADNVLLVGCGTSYHAAVDGKYLIEELAQLPSEVEFADEMKGRRFAIGEHTIAIVLSQSGETGDAIAAAKMLKKKKTLVIGITNVAGSALSKIADVVITNDAGQEKALAATKTFTSQLLILAMLSLYFLQVKKSKVSTPIIKELKLLPGKMEKILGLQAEIKALASKIYKEKEILFFGKRYNYPLAMEAALKLKETTYIPAESYATGEFKHGPMAIVDKKTVCLFLAPRDSAWRANLSIAAETKANGAKIIMMTDATKAQTKKTTDWLIRTPKTIEPLFPLLMAVPIQLLAYHIALKKGINVDKPRNLNKFVK